MDRQGNLGRPLAWLVHFYTATGAALALLASFAILNGDYRRAFLYLFCAVIVDATDGWLARRARVADVLPHIDGRKLDDVVDYATFVFVPALLIYRAGLLPDSISPVVLSLVLMASVFGFANVAAKTTDHFFTGFPSYWNIAAFYLFVLNLPALWNAAILLVLSTLVFVPIKYVYPSRTKTLQELTFVLCALWGVVLLWMIWRLPGTPASVVAWSLLFPIYYAALSLVLSHRTGPNIKP